MMPMVLTSSNKQKRAIMLHDWSIQKLDSESNQSEACFLREFIKIQIKELVENIFNND